MNTHPTHRCLFGILFAAALAMDRGFAQEGGYVPVPVDDEQVVEAAAFAVTAQQEAMKEAGDGKGPEPRLRLLEIRHAHRQLVSGFNFRLDLRVRVGSEERRVVAVVYWNLDDELDLTSWAWSADDEEARSATDR